CLLGQKLRKSKFSHVITAAITCWKSFDLIMARARACPGTYCCQPSPLTPLPSDGRGENKERLRFFTVTGTEANTIAGKKNCFRPDTRPRLPALPWQNVAMWFWELMRIALAKE